MKQSDKKIIHCRCAWIYITLMLILILGISNLSAEVASITDAKQAGQNWLNYIVYQNGSWNESVSPYLMDGEEIYFEDQILGYYFPVNPSGYMVVPIIKELPPIKLYDETGYLDMADSQGFAGLIKDVLHHRITMFIKRYGSLDVVQPKTGDILLDPVHRERWTQLLKSEAEFLADLDANKMSRATTVGPLLTSTWHQRGPYNSMCPVGDDGCATCPGGSPPSSDTVVVGCVATAAAQLMNYWQWPPSGVSSHSYSWDGDQTCDDDVGGGTLAANFSDAYDWDNILDTYGGGATQAEIDAVAELCYDLAVAFEMDFGVCGSGAYTDDALTVYPNFFRYDATTIDKEDRDDDHTAAEWFTILQNEINGNQPMQYRIKGHSIVCDGWRDTGPENEIHMNYGWGGGSNAWYTIDHLHCDWEGCDPMVEYVIRGIRPVNQPPVAVCADVTMNADDNCESWYGNIDDGSYDPEGYDLTITQLPPPPYHLGENPCMLIVEDPQGATDVCYAYIIVEDRWSPEAICPADISQGNDPDECSAVVTFAIDATDNCPGVTVAAVPPSGSVFPVGVTEVVVTATDEAGNTDVCRFDVAVADTQNPEIVCPEEIEVTFISPTEATADYEATATDNCNADPTITYNPPPGSTFGIGVNTVICYADDGAGNMDTCEFSFVLAYVDIKPGSCPNAFNIKPYTFDHNDDSFTKEIPDIPFEDGFDRKPPQGVLPVAILGLEDFDVRIITPESILLNGVAPLRWEYEDVATPAESEDGYCGCTTADHDGFMDLTLKFSTKEIVESLGSVNDGDVVQLILTSKLVDDMPLYGGDCVLIRGPHNTGEVVSAIQPKAPTIKLLGATPNPFNPITTLSFTLNQPGDYILTIFNITGQIVETFTSRGQPGLNQVVWDASRFTSGVYFYRLNALGLSETKKMLLVK
jgi:Peptidase C10 family/HYR domain/Secretion system C-terminal sorting domain